MKKAKHVDLEGHFGSQNPALQPTAEDFAAISQYIQQQKKQQAAKAEKQQKLPRRQEAA